MRAMASSLPGSVSKIIFLAARAGRAVRSRSVTTIEDLEICFLLS
jgi:hypothetical protein